MKFVDFVRSADLIGPRIEGFSLKGRYNYQTLPGGLFSVAMKLIVLSYAFLQFYIMVNRQDTQHQTRFETDYFNENDVFGG